MTSGVKVKSKIPIIEGTKPSIKNAQLLVSSGIPSLDNIIGGGLPIGSIFLIEEDTYGSFAKIMLKYFMAEGIVSHHSLLVASQDAKTSEMISDLPAPTTTTASPPSIESQDTTPMKIAWRYENMKVSDTSTPKNQALGHFYDLTKKMPPESIQNANIIQWNGCNIEGNSRVFTNHAYFDLLRLVQSTLKNGEFFSSHTPDKRTVLRIAIHSLGSRLWLSDSVEDTHRDLLKFLYCLRSLLRESYAVVAVTIPVEHFDASSEVVQRIEHISDISLKIDPFVGSLGEQNAAFKNYHGLLHIHKLSALNTLAPHRPESRELAFKLSRKIFHIEIFHLPPELEDSAQREQDEAAQPSCMSGGNSKLSF